MTNRTEQLHQLMAEHDLKASKVGEMLGRSPSTVRIWRCRLDPRQIPEHTLEVLKQKLAQVQREKLLMDTLQEIEDFTAKAVQATPTHFAGIGAKS